MARGTARGSSFDVCFAKGVAFWWLYCIQRFIDGSTTKGDLLISGLQGNRLLSIGGLESE